MLINYYRGEIYYIHLEPVVGSEQKAGRPAIIISNDINNRYSPVVEVVYLTTQPKNDLPTHVTIRQTKMDSVALCEQIDTVSKLRIGNYCGKCSEEEMNMINIALLVSVGINIDCNINANNKYTKMADKLIEMDQQIFSRLFNLVNSATANKREELFNEYIERKKEI